MEFHLAVVVVLAKLVSMLLVLNQILLLMLVMVVMVLIHIFQDLQIIILEVVVEQPKVVPQQ